MDRLHRRPLMIVADIGRALLLGTIPAAALLHALRIEQLYVVTFFAALLTLFFDLAYRSYLPTLIRPEELVEGNSKLTASASVAEFGAFSLAGWLVQWLTGPIAVLIDAISFVFSALCLGLIRRPEPPPIPHEEREGWKRELAEGLRAVRGNPILRTLAAVSILIGLSGGIFGAIVVAYMVRDLGFKPGVLGMIWAVGGLTSMMGALAAEPLSKRFGVGRTIAGGILIAGLGSLMIPLAHGVSLLSAAFLIAAQVISDPSYTIFEINQVSLRQSITPNRLLGRVSSTLEFAGLGAMLVGGLAGGLLGGAIGLRWTLVIGTTGSFVAALLVVLSPVGRVYTAEPAIAEALS